MQWFNLQDNINLLALLGTLILVIATLGVVGKYIKQMREAKGKAELSEHNWDGIGEYKNEIPIGWSITFVVMLVWAIWYFLAGYPLNSYSQIGEYNEEVRDAEAKFEAKFTNLTREQLREMGSGVFLVQCAVCHGVTGEGMDEKAANLSAWGNEEGIFKAIMNGSKGLGYAGGEMPAGLGGDENSAKAIAAYVAKEISAIKSTKNENLLSLGKELYATCAACHGEDGKGMDGLSPDLSKYGSVEFVKDVLARGKSGAIGIMPKFSDRLNDIRQNALGEYLITLSGGEDGK